MSVDPMELQYVMSNGASIAYADWGGGGPAILLLMPGSVEALIETAFEQSWFALLRRIGRLVMVDLRGRGASAPMNLDSPLTAEERVDDLIAVLDATHIERVVVVGIADGAALSALFGARHPDRVERMVLFNGYAKMLATDDYPVGISAAEFTSRHVRLETEWGHGWHVPMLTPDRVGDEPFRRLWARIERMTATPAGAAAILRSDAELDLRPVLVEITAPTLVLSRRRIGLVPESAGRDLASRIPGATYVELEADTDFSIFDDIRTEIEGFLTGARSSEDVDRRLVTVLQTDLVGSTRTLSDVGDKRWRQLLDLHDEMCGAVVGRYGGRRIKSTGDGVLATFDSPSRALRCARDLVRELSAAGISTRAGVHTGEIEMRGDDIGGIAVHLVARVTAIASGAEVLVSRTVPDVVIGSGLHFQEHGTHELRGIPGVWQLYQLTDSS